MANEGEFPKTDGDIYYGKDANMTYYQADGASTLNYSNISVTTSATLIKASNSSRKRILIRNLHSVSIWIGDSGVLTTDGFELKPKECIVLWDTAAIYGIVLADTADIRYLEAQ